MTQEQIDELFVNYDIARLVEEKDFTDDCFMYYDKTGKIGQKCGHTSAAMRSLGFTPAPLFDQVLGWLRKKDIHIDIEQSESNDLYMIWISNMWPTKDVYNTWGRYLTHSDFSYIELPYNEARTLAIEEAIKIISNARIIITSAEEE